MTPTFTRTSEADVALVIDLDDSRELDVLLSITRTLATAVGVDPDDATRQARRAAERPLPTALPPFPGHRVRRSLPARTAKDTTLLAPGVVELACHLVTATIRDQRVPDLMGGLVARALDHFHPTAMIAALDAEAEITAQLATLVDRR